MLITVILVLVVEIIIVYLIKPYRLIVSRCVGEFLGEIIKNAHINSLIVLIGETLAKLSSNGIKIDVVGKVKMFEFIVGKTKFTIPLPFDRRKKRVDIRIVKHNEEININYPVGIPFLVTADELGCHSIIVTNSEGDEYVYTGSDSVII